MSFVTSMWLKWPRSWSRLATRLALWGTTGVSRASSRGYCEVSGVRDPDRESAARFCVAVGAAGAERWQVFHRRAVSCMFGVAERARSRCGPDAGGSWCPSSSRQDRDAAPVPSFFDARW